MLSTDTVLILSCHQTTGEQGLQHENIVGMVDCFMTPNVLDPAITDLYIVMEHAGEDLLTTQTNMRMEVRSPHHADEHVQTNMRMEVTDEHAHGGNRRTCAWR